MCRSAKWRTARKRGEPFFWSQFSVRTIFLMTVPLAVIVAVGVRVPGLNGYAWQSVVLLVSEGGSRTCRFMDC